VLARMREGVMPMRDEVKAAGRAAPAAKRA
jgi:hypothetical protein